MTETDVEAAKVLSDFFSSVFVREGSDEVPRMEVNSDDSLQPPEPMPAVDIDTEDVLKRLTCLKDNKSPGPDGLHPKFLIMAANALAEPLAMLFRKSIATGKLPLDWKSALVSPIFKKGSKVDPGNYRPVSLTCIPCKILESIIRDHMLQYLEGRDVLSLYQHGFINGRSCLSNLLVTLENWTAALEEGYGLDIFYLDYQKAFDTVPHKRLLAKLEWYGTDIQVLNWIQNFLMNRRMNVVVNGSRSGWADVYSGVPQGSILGPVLFILYVNDLPKKVRCGIQMFADDTKLWTTVQKVDDQAKLQNDLDSLEDWSKTWLLKFNSSKCKVMHVGHSVQTEYCMSNNGKEYTVTETDKERDLGVHITKDLKWSTQCSKAASKAMQALGLIKRNFSQLDKHSFLVMYNTYVRPHLEYCAQAWNPYLKKDITCLEKVQRRATKLVKEVKHLKYEDRLRALQLFSLKYRRLRGTLIETYKILTGKLKIESDQFFKLSSSSLRGTQSEALQAVCIKMLSQRVFTAHQHSLLCRALY